MMFFSFSESEDLQNKRRPRRSREVRKPDDELSWYRLEKQSQSGEIIRVRITGRYLYPYPNLSREAQEGGILVEASGLPGFIPKWHKLPNIIHEIGVETSVKIIELSKERRRLVFSEREARLKSC